MNVTFIPILLIDLFGSIAMIVLSFLCLRLVLRLRKQDKNNIIWTYLLAICIGLACFAVSRSAGHILKNIVSLMGYEYIWNSVRPFSGAINTFMFVVVASITLFFERVWKIYQIILKDRQALKSAHEELLFLNQNLEEIVRERTMALSVSEYKYRQIFEVSKDTILVAKKDGTILNMNPAGYKLLGLENQSQQLQERKIQDFLLDYDWKTILDKMEDEESISSVELRLKTLNGADSRTLFSGSIVKDPADDADTFLFVIKDIELRKTMEEQMAQADKLASIGELSSGIAHEINNPLNVILGYTQLLLRQEERESGRYADLKTIEKHVRSCKNIVEDLLNFSRTSKTEKERLNIHTIIDEVIHFVRRHSKLERIHIINVYDREIPLLQLDAKKIKQVLINLIMNAIHSFGQDGTGNITIATGIQKNTGQVYVHVMDEGCGIEKKNVAKIFDPFFTTKPTGQGTGLGLSVSYGIIKDHGGDIKVKSELGKGTTFTLVLPETARAR